MEWLVQDIYKRVILSSYPHLKLINKYDGINDYTLVVNDIAMYTMDIGDTHIMLDMNPFKHIYLTDMERNYDLPLSSYTVEIENGDIHNAIFSVFEHLLYFIKHDSKFKRVYS